VSRGLTREAFEALLALFNTDREKAAEKYEQIRRKLIGVFEWKGCSIPEELADEVFNRVGYKAAEGLVIQREEPFAYISGVAHHVWQEYLRRKVKEPIPFESSSLIPLAPPEDEPDSRLDHIRGCLKLLEPEQRSLLLRYYVDDQRIQSRKRICEELDIPMNALRIRIHRLRKKVESCVQEMLRN